MAAPANRFDKVDGPDPRSVTVSIGGSADAPSGEVLGPQDTPGAAVRLGQDGSLTALQALAVGCHLANQIERPVVVVDPDGRWRAAWGRLGPA